jgi:transcriptional regulator of met regulon
MYIVDLSSVPMVHNSEEIKKMYVGVSTKVCEVYTTTINRNFNLGNYATNTLILTKKGFKIYI